VGVESDVVVDELADEGESRSERRVGVLAERVVVILVERLDGVALGVDNGDAVLVDRPYGSPVFASVRSVPIFGLSAWSDPGCRAACPRAGTETGS
jgi:hypothetical protein